MSKEQPKELYLSDIVNFLWSKRFLDHLRESDRHI